MELKRVKCRVCSFSDGKKCTIKKVKVAQNKARCCDIFEYVAEKVQIKQKLKSSYTPFHMRNKKEYKKWSTEQKKKEINESMESKITALQKPDILNKFRSNAPNE